MEYNVADQLTRWPGERWYEYDGRGDLSYKKSDSNTLQKIALFQKDELATSTNTIGRKEGVNRCKDEMIAQGYALPIAGVHKSHILYILSQVIQQW